MRLNASGTAITAANRIGPGGSYVIVAGVAVDTRGASYVTGVFDDDDPRVFIDRVETDGTVSSEYFLNGIQSGLGSPAWDQASAIALDSAGDVYRHRQHDGVRLSDDAERAAAALWQRRARRLHLEGQLQRRVRTATRIWRAAVRVVGVVRRKRRKYAASNAVDAR